MKLRTILWVLSPVVLSLASAPTRAQEDYVRVELRVISSKPVVVDRGSGDGLAIGDVVRFFARGGSTYRGNVKDVDARSAVVDLVDTNYVPEPGTKAEARIPRSRFGDEEAVEPPPVPPAEPPSELPVGESDPEGAVEPGEDATGKVEHEKWENQDEDWKPGMPLLAEVEPVRPRDRATSVSGVLYARGHSTLGTENGRSDSLYTTGFNVRYENPWGRGGRLRLAGDFNYRNVNVPDRTNRNDLDFRLDRLSYMQGGTRFEPNRWEVGRFLQQGMPEFGYLDGVEWGRRRENGDRFGVSVGAMPERDYEFNTGGDLQISTYYEWVEGERDELTFAAGYQKTWHHSNPDRDLLVTRFRYLPYDAWNYNATLWVDYYTGADDAKDATLEVTQAIVSANRRYENGNGLDLTYYRIRFPDIDRNEEFVPPLTRQEIENNRNDRLALSGWTWAGDELRLFGHVGAWDDEDDSGGDGELGFEVFDTFGTESQLSLSTFATSGQFEDSIGGRLNLARNLAAGRWNLYYEFANHRRNGFSSDFNDIGQHRLRGTRDWYLPNGWTLSLYGEGAYWDEEGAWSVGFFLQRIF